MNAPYDILEMLKTVPDGRILEAFHVTTFRCTRRDDNGAAMEVLVEILDAGPGAGLARYVVEVTGENEEYVATNPAESIEAALALVPWHELEEVHA
jgi:hypothetical protein